LGDIKNDPVEEQSIDSNETSLLGNVLNLTEVSQGTNSVEVLSVKSKDTKSDLVEE